MNVLANLPHDTVPPTEDEVAVIDLLFKPAVNASAGLESFCPQWVSVLISYLLLVSIVYLVYILPDRFVASPYLPSRGVPVLKAITVCVAYYVVTIFV